MRGHAPWAMEDFECWRATAIAETEAAQPVVQLPIELRTGVPVLPPSGLGLRARGRTRPVQWRDRWGGGWDGDVGGCERGDLACLSFDRPEEAGRRRPARRRPAARRDPRLMRRDRAGPGGDVELGRPRVQDADQRLDRSYLLPRARKRGSEDGRHEEAERGERRLKGHL